MKEALCEGSRAVGALARRLFALLVASRTVVPVAREVPDVRAGNLAQVNFR